MNYRRKPAQVEAFQWTGGRDQEEDPQWIVDAIKAKVVTFGQRMGHGPIMLIRNLRGQTLVAEQGDWIVRNEAGYVHPVEGDVFDKLYEAV